VADYYRFGDLIGKGGYGRVYSAQEKATGTVVFIMIRIDKSH
jgi:serine/threonine protein kinase